MDAIKTRFTSEMELMSSHEKASVQKPALTTTRNIRAATLLKMDAIKTRFTSERNLFLSGDKASNLPDVESTTKSTDDDALSSDCELDEAKELSWGQMTSFTLAIAAYRIIKFSIHLFMVLRIEELNMGVSRAGFIYLLQSLGRALTGVILVKFPAVLFRFQMVFPIISVLLMTGGFFGTFMSENFVAMAASALLCGIGVAAWYIYYQTLTNLTFSKRQLGDATRMRQGFDCLGFLLPSICLAITNHFADPPITSNELSVVQKSVIVLGTISLLFYLLSFRIIMSSAIKLSCCSPDSPFLEEKPASDSVWGALKQFWGTSVSLYSLLSAFIHSAASIYMGTLSLTTEVIFGIDPTFLWIASIGFPLGGMIGAMGWVRDPKTATAGGSVCFVVMFSLIIAFSPFVSLDNDKVAKVLLFLFGTVYSILFSVTYVGAQELWFQRLMHCQTSFVCQASAIGDLGIQAIVACAFQLQTILLEQTIFHDGQFQENSKIVEALVFFAPLVGFFVIAYTLVKVLPYEPQVVNTKKLELEVLKEQDKVETTEESNEDPDEVSDEVSC